MRLQPKPLTDFQKKQIFQEILDEAKKVLKLKGRDIPFVCVDGRGYEYRPEDYDKARE